MAKTKTARKKVARKSAKKKASKKRVEKSTSKKVKKEPARGTGARAESDVTVSMFCHGLGDCFLITVPQGDARPYSILIDCGVAKGTAEPAKKMAAVVAKIAELASDPNAPNDISVIDVLIVTHEHLDHVSGFSQAQEAFSELIDFRNVWFAWTENRRDKLSQELRDRFGKAKLALANVRARLASNGNDGSTAARLLHLDGVMAFADMNGNDHALAAAAGPGDLEKGMEFVRKVAKELDDGAVRYLKPGECLSLPDAPPGSLASGIRAYIMGPPHDRAKITRINPSKTNPEVYEKQGEKHRHAAAEAGVNWSWRTDAMHAVD